MWVFVIAFVFFFMYWFARSTRIYLNIMIRVIGFMTAIEKWSHFLEKEKSTTDSFLAHILQYFNEKNIFSSSADRFTAIVYVKRISKKH